MQNKLELLTTIKNKNFEHLKCKLWVIKKRTIKAKNSYKALSAGISGLEEDFKNSLKYFFCGQGNGKDPIRQLSEYSTLTVELDEDKALIHSVDKTDFSKIIEKIEEGSDNDAVQEINQFNNAWALVIEFKDENSKFYGFSKIKGGWNLRSRKSIKNWIFREGQFEKVVAEKIFTFRNSIDFVSYNKDVFIRDKANYELGLNIREGLIAKRDELVKALESHGIVASVEDLKIAVGTNKTFLRRLVAIEETRYFEDQQFIEDMKGVIDEHGWELPINNNGKFVIDENNIDLFLKLINDKRFTSLIKQQMVDADAVEVVRMAEEA